MILRPRGHPALSLGAIAARSSCPGTLQSFLLRPMSELHAQWLSFVQSVLQRLQPAMDQTTGRVCDAVLRRKRKSRSVKSGSVQIASWVEIQGDDSRSFLGNARTLERVQKLVCSCIVVGLYLTQHVRTLQQPGAFVNNLLAQCAPRCRWPNPTPMAIFRTRLEPFSEILRPRCVLAFGIPRPSLPEGSRALTHTGLLSIRPAIRYGTSRRSRLVCSWFSRVADRKQQRADNEHGKANPPDPLGPAWTRSLA